MTLEEFAAQWEAHSDEFIMFGRVVAPPFKRPDLCAFMRLEELAPCGDDDLVCWAERGEIGLSTSAEAVASVATEDDIIFLIRCGVRYDSDDGFRMFV